MKQRAEKKASFFIRKYKKVASFLLDLLPFHFCFLLFPGLENKPKCIINIALFYFVAVNGQKWSQENTSICLLSQTHLRKLYPSSLKMIFAEVNLENNGRLCSMVWSNYWSAYSFKSCAKLQKISFKPEGKEFQFSKLSSIIFIPTATTTGH